MKVAIECKSPLLQKSLEIFLSKNLSNLKNCDIIIKDIKCESNRKCFYISSKNDADLKKPFSKQSLLTALEYKYEVLNTPQEYDEEINETQTPIEELKVQTIKNKDFSILEERLDIVTKEYQENILNIVREFYEKQ